MDDATGCDTRQMTVPLSFRVAEGIRAAGYRDDISGRQLRSGRHEPVWDMKVSQDRKTYVVASSQPSSFQRILGGTWEGLLGLVLVDPDGGTVRVEVAGRKNEAAMTLVRDAIEASTGLCDIPLVLGCE